MHAGILNQRFKVRVLDIVCSQNITIRQTPVGSGSSFAQTPPDTVATAHPQQLSSYSVGSLHKIRRRVVNIDALNSLA